MHSRWRAAATTVAVGAALTAAACTSARSEKAGTHTAASSPAPLPEGAAALNTYFDGPEPTEVATDPPAPTTQEPTDVATESPGTAARDDESPDDGSPDAGVIPIVLTYSGFTTASMAVEVDGYVPGIVEDGGTCTLTLTHGSESLTASVPGTANVKHTACGGAAVPRERLSPGTWTAVLSYESAGSRGSSEPARVVVP
jgi:hypothetical protein